MQSFFLLLFSIAILHAPLLSEVPLVETEKPQSAHKEHPLPAKTFEPFTGKISKNRVRVRLKPHYDDQVLKEAHAGDLYVVVGEDEDFYAVQAPSNLKGYVYRTFVLDNVIEGNRVNVRLKPDLEAPVIAQLHSGDRVNATVVAENTKWVEISVPSTARFYIAKEYVTKAGDSGFLARMERKKEEASHLLQTVSRLGSIEMAKPFKEINFQSLEKGYENLIQHFPEFPDILAKAQEELKTLREAYLAKKVAFLEEESKLSSSAKEMNQKLIEELNQQKSKLAKLEQEAQSYRPMIKATEQEIQALPATMRNWIGREEAYFQAWRNETGNHSLQAYHDEQIHHSLTLTGIIEPYQKNVNNKPGDFLFVHATSRIPFAFLYSTSINLQDLVGKEVTLRVVSRPNHHFAFPAYLVIAVE